jgi:hypothetical protein
MIAKHTKYGRVYVLRLTPSNRGGLALIATPWIGRGPRRKRLQPGPVWVRAKSVGLSFWF